MWNIFHSESESRFSKNKKIKYIENSVHFNTDKKNVENSVHLSIECVN
jgi:hypothetical protein